ncbi:MAG: hypothetical protein QM747_01005 [Nocardioides sp.]
MEARIASHRLPEGATEMFGPLPVLHRIVLAAISLCFGVIAGMWIAHMTPLPVAVSGGALAGGLLGLAAAYILGHTHEPAPRPVRVTRRR